MKTYRYQLQPYKGGKTRYRCPQCSVDKAFVRYIDTATGSQLPEQYGRCNRESKCGYHISPYKQGYQPGASLQAPAKRQSADDKPPAYIPAHILRQTLRSYGQNRFVQNILSGSGFADDAVQAVIAEYSLGTIGKGRMAGAATFPFIDINGNVRAIQVKEFDAHNHAIHTGFMHSLLAEHYRRQKAALPGWLKSYQHNGRYITCLFGEHLLSRYPDSPVALVEAPKTAIYGRLYVGSPLHPGNPVWLAVYNKSSFSYQKLKVLKGRDVFVYPDLSDGGKTFTEWQQKALRYKYAMPETGFYFSDLLERQASGTERAQGLDIADYLGCR